jgi:hypothetical protein
MTDFPRWFAVGFPLIISLLGLAILLHIFACTLEQRRNR